MRLPAVTPSGSSSARIGRNRFQSKSWFGPRPWLALFGWLGCLFQLYGQSVHKRGSARPGFPERALLCARDALFRKRQLVFSVQCVSRQPYCNASALANEVRLDLALGSRSLDACGLTSLNALQQPCHVVAQNAHDLHALFILLILAGDGAECVVPVIG